MIDKFINGVCGVVKRFAWVLFLFWLFFMAGPKPFGIQVLEKLSPEGATAAREMNAVGTVKWEPLYVPVNKYEVNK